MTANNNISFIYSTLILFSLSFAPMAQAGNINTWSHTHMCVHTVNGKAHPCKKHGHYATKTTTAALSTINFGSDENITDSNVAPMVALEVSQDDNPTRKISNDGGVVTVSVQVSDPNNGNQHSYDWSMTDNNLVRLGDAQTKPDEFSFDPSQLLPGFYNLQVTVTDNGNPLLSNSSSMLIEVVSIKSKDGDDDDVDSDGIINAADTEDLNDNELQVKKGDDNANHALRTNPGLKLALGKIAFESHHNAAKISEQDIAEKGDGRHAYSSDNHLNAGGFFDFEVSHIHAPGHSVNVVIPLAQAIPAHAVYREYSPRMGWHNFSEDSDNSVKSAIGAKGKCPEPGDNAYKKGLIAGGHCVELSLKDGGANDNDGVADNIVKFTGGLAVKPVPAVTKIHRRHKKKMSHNSHHHNFGHHSKRHHSRHHN